jgi:hypothetical protein
LYHATHVFFWNTLSESALIRGQWGKTAFFFDPGHMFHFFRPLYSFAVPLFLRDAQEFPFIKFTERISDELLEKQTTAIQKHFSSTWRKIYQQLPQPQEIIKDCLQKMPEGENTCQK